MTLCHCGSIYAKSFSFQKSKLLEISCAPSEHGPLESPDPCDDAFPPPLLLYPVGCSQEGLGAGCSSGGCLSLVFASVPTTLLSFVWM